MRKNIVTMTDSYKYTHHQMTPEDTEVIYSYFESRNGAKFDETVFVGLQYLIKEYLEGVVVTREKIEEAAALSEAHFMNPSMFNREMWEHILENHGGKLPIRIKAVPEGTPVPTSNVLMTVENTDPKCSALTNHLETILTHVWAPSTVASLSRETKSIMLDYLLETSDQTDSLAFAMHDFGFRGVSSRESAGIEGMAHIVNFMGTDTVVAMETAMEYYGSSMNGLAYSVPASEHSVMTAEGMEGEANVLQRILDAYPVGIVSVVADSYNISNFVTNFICGTFKEQINNRNHPEIPCKVVVRPDSLRSPEDTPEKQMVWIAETLWDNWGGTVNSKGYKVIDPHVGMLWGDGIDLEGIVKILMALKNAGFSTENAVFGSGGGLLQKINRDTQRFAFKCSAQKRSGQWIDVSKKPLDASKASKKGRLILDKDVRDGQYRTYRLGETIEQGIRAQEENDVLQTVFENGELVKEYTFDDLRENAKL
jgi:nicotinamide phosphoribosyltransferase